jgi:hypothetical protein
VTIVIAPSQIVPGIGKEAYHLQIAELLPAIAIYAMENGIVPAGSPYSGMAEGSAEEGVMADLEGSDAAGAAFFPSQFRIG